jgi:hypothetical protein
LGTGKDSAAAEKAAFRDKKEARIMHFMIVALRSF